MYNNLILKYKLTVANKYSGKITNNRATNSDNTVNYKEWQIGSIIKYHILRVSSQQSNLKIMIDKNPEKIIKTNDKELVRIIY